MLFFNSKDRDRDGRISYEEFCDRETVNERAFKAMDINSDGYITKTEMLKASNRGSRRLSAADIDACFREFDKDKDNRLSYDEFCLMMNTRRQSVEEHLLMKAPTPPAAEDVLSVATTQTTVSSGSRKGSPKK